MALKQRRLLDALRFDVVITDLVMPGGIGGIELLNRAKEKDVNIEVIVITAHSSVATAVEAIKKGAVDYLEKPVNFDQLLLRLEKICEEKSLDKNAGDLRGVLEMTESSAAQTIQNLEMINSTLQEKLNQAKAVLNDFRMDECNRIEKALQLLDSRSLCSMDCNQTAQDGFARLQGIVARLRGENGCPWDIRQTPESLKKYLLEECEELAEAVDLRQEQAICEEIGDVLFILTMLIDIYAAQGHLFPNIIIQNTPNSQGREIP